jgi:diguanylate cyclase (GGDEF)-like protein
VASRLQARPERDTGRFSGAVHPGDGQRLGAFARLPFLPLTAYVALPQEAVWSAWWRRSRPLFLSFGLYLGLLGGLSHLVTRRERYYRGELHSLARVDSLTGLANGLGFSEDLAEATARHQRSGGDLALLLLDLDNFKEVNDRFGHGVGDELLQAVARRLEVHMRTGDRLARRSGDEFLVLLNDVDAEGAASSATRILELFAQPFEVAGRTVALTPSIGIATRSRHTGEGDLQQQADSALEAAKEQGGNQYVFFAREMGEAIRRKLDLKQDLVRAWEQGEFRMHFQPLYRLSDHALMGAEALMRWQDPEQGMRSPAEFIPLAEETGLIVPMGRWAMETACAEVRDWRGGLAPLYLSLNVSPRQMGEPDFEEQVAEVLHRTGLPPERLLLEITESIAMAAEEEGNRLLHRLRERGVRIAVDDFGTGYSSLSYLENLPVDLIKIDRSFVARLDQPETRTIIQVIIDLTDTLGLECLAEGIETADQEEALRRLGCELGQGYRYGRPLPAEAFREAFL